MRGETKAHSGDDAFFLNGREGVTPGGCRNDLGRQFQISTVGAAQTGPGAPLEVHTWLHSEIGLLSPFADWLMSLIARFRLRSREGGVR